MVKKSYTPEQIINKLRDELLNRKVFATLTEAKVLIKQWRRYNRVRPHSSLGYRPPATCSLRIAGRKARRKM